MITVEALLTERELADELVAAFAARSIPEKFFYWLPLSVRAWLALCGDGEYRNFVRSRSLIARSADEIAAIAGPGPREVLSLGSGQGDKDLILLEALRRNGADVSYVPFDTSQALLELACAGAGAAGFAARGVKADLTRADHLAAIAPRDPTPPRLVLLVGNTLGALDPLAMARELRRLLRSGDLLLLDGELYAGAETLGGYDNPVNRRFAWAPLLGVGVREDDGELRFELAEDARLPGLHLIPKHFRASRDTSALIGGERLPIRAGERIAMSYSYKYAPETFLRILADAELGVVWQAASDDGRFIMALAQPR